VVVEAAAHGTPAVVVAGPDNAAVDLVTGGVNGTVVARPDAEETAAAVVGVFQAGQQLRDATAEWCAREAPLRSRASSVARVLEIYPELLRD
jgi:glycosyltransferase involved in cell wall biosynthesis